MVKVVAVVLAGGRSTRFGSEKAMARVTGSPMIARTVAVLRTGAADLAVNATSDSRAAAWAAERSLAVLPDPLNLPEGPLSGVLAGLEWAQAQGADVLVTAPCDTPWLPRDLVARLVGGLGEAPAAAVTADGSQPLCAAWRVGLLPRLRDTLETRHPSVRLWLQEVGAAQVPFDDARAFRNVNHPPELRARMLDAGSAVLLTLLAWIGVFFVLFVFNFGDALNEEGRRRAVIAGRITAGVCLLLAMLVPIAAIRLARRAGASRRR